MDEALQDISLTAAVMMITAASPHNIELTQIHLQYHLSSFPLHLNVRKPSSSPDSCVGRDDPTSLSLHVKPLLHCASLSRLAPGHPSIFYCTLHLSIVQLLARGQVESYAIGEQKYHRYSTLPTL